MPPDCRSTTGLRPRGYWPQWNNWPAGCRTGVEGVSRNQWRWYLYWQRCKRRSEDRGGRGRLCVSDCSKL